MLQPLLTRTRHNVFARGTADVDLDELVAVTRELLAGRSLYRAELGQLLEARWPGRDRTALGWSAQYLEPVVHPPSGGTWNSTGRTPFVLASDWLGPPPGMPADGLSGPQRLVRRYLAAYGPATVSDIRAWSGVSGLREVVDSQRGELRVLADEAGRDLVDLPDGSRPEPDIPAPIRFLPEFDNLLLAYADRTRMMSDPVRRQVYVGDAVAATVLVDGVVGATWSLTRDSGTAVLTIRPFHPWSRTDGAAVIEEGTRLLAFAAADASESMVRIDPEDGGTGG